MGFDLVIDASAVVCIYMGEPEVARVLDALNAASTPAIPAPTLLEASMVLSSRLGREVEGDLRRFLQSSRIEVIPFGPEEAWNALRAFERFGKGRHPAKLNYGDCMVYAIAKQLGVPVLCTGDDFLQTDVAKA